MFSFVFGCFSVPIIIYATSSDVTPSQEIRVDIDIENCPQQVINNSELQGIERGARSYLVN